MRVTGGLLRGRVLRVPRGRRVRPTADRVRESVFARLDVEGARVLDLFAGTGALGIEALSRGASHARFVERVPTVVATLRHNLESLDLLSRSDVLRAPLPGALARLARSGPYDLILVDPPYEAGLAPRVLESVARLGLLAPGGRVVLEAALRHPPGAVAGLELEDERRYGDTLVLRYTRGGPHATSEETGSVDERLALFAASFDPVTNGHLDLVRRAHRVFPNLVVAVASNVAKTGTFTVDQRLDMLRTALADAPEVRVSSFEDRLLVDYARELGANVLIRGLRAMADFEYEFEMALMNKHMNADVETIFMMTSQEYFYVSSSRLKELVHFGADISEWVPPVVEKYLREKLGR